MQNKNELEYLRNRVNELESEIESQLEERIGELKLSEEKFRLLFEKSQDPILIIDDYNFVECNDMTVKVLGYSTKDEILNLHPSKLSQEFQPDRKLSYEKAQEMMKITYTTGYHRFEWVHLDKKGNEIFLDVSLTKIPYKGKDMIFTVWRNISKQKHNEKNIIEKGKQISALFEQAADGILVGIKGGKIIEANESILRLTAYKKDELIGENINTLFEKEQLNAKPLRYDLVKKGDTIIRERNIIRKDGKVIPIEMNTKILDDGRMQALFRDLTKRKETETALKESEEKYRNIFQYSPLGILHYDKNGIIQDCNESFIKIIGSSKEALIGFDIFKRAKDEKLRKSVLESIEKGESYYKDWYSSVTANKSTFVRIFFKGIKDINNKIVSGIGLVEDITERKEIEQRIYNAVLETEQKERQRLASDLHDEIGPLLSSLKMYIESLNETNDAKKQKYIKSQLKSLIKESIINVREVSNALSPYLLSKYGMSIAIKSFFKNSKELIKNTFETNLKEERFPINIETAFYRITKELFNNTVKHAGAKNIKISLNYVENKLILIYEDDGKGIKKTDLKNVEQKGMGLLNITNRIKSINGKYKFFTDLKSGFKFQVSKETEIIKR